MKLNSLRLKSGPVAAIWKVPRFGNFYYYELLTVVEAFRLPVSSTRYKLIQLVLLYIC